jgi:hypothetical protein
MRFLAVAALATLITICIIVIVLALAEYRRWRRRHLERHAQWVDVTVNANDVTYVSVQRVAETFAGRVVLDEQHIGFVGHNTPDWGVRFMQLQNKAWDRAMALNAKP